MKPIYEDEEMKLFYSRIKPFVLAEARYRLMTAIGDQWEQVMCSNVDSIYTKVKLTEKEGVTMGDNIGNLKYEGMCPDMEIQPNRKRKCHCEKGCEL